MKTYIKHRVNQISELDEIEPNWGVEIDLRSNVQNSKSLHLSHDPWIVGDDFGEWLQKFASLQIKGPLILNTKEDGLENQILELLDQNQISNFFFLDTTIPTLVKWAVKSKLSNFAVRYSHYEPTESVTIFQGKADWLWVDCFDGNPVNADIILRLKKNFKICLVSPELHGQPTDQIANFSLLYGAADAICTKNPSEWQKRFKTSP
jgi:hypothetical protein